jgi:cobalamin biosynthesis protein CobT
MTGLLRSQLDKDDRCGDRIAIQQASLTPAGPSSLAVVQLHYERYACVKALGKQMARKLVGGNGVIQMKLTPTVEEGKTLRLVPEVESIQTDGSLGKLLRSGPVGDMLREKITKALLSAMQKGTDRSLTLPPAAQDIAVIDKAQFTDTGSGRLALALGGEVPISEKQIQFLRSQLKERMPAR